MVKKLGEEEEEFRRRMGEQYKQQAERVKEVSEKEVWRRDNASG